MEAGALSFPVMLLFVAPASAFGPGIFMGLHMLLRLSMGLLLPARLLHVLLHMLLLHLRRLLHVLLLHVLLLHHMLLLHLRLLATRLGMIIIHSGVMIPHICMILGIRMILRHRVIYGTRVDMLSLGMVAGAVHPVHGHIGRPAVIYCGELGFVPAGRLLVSGLFACPFYM